MRNRTFVLVVCIASLLLANLSVVRALIDLSRQDDTASHLVLIPFVSLALIYARRDVIFATVRTAWSAGIVMILSGVSLSVWGRLSDRNSLSLLASGLVVSWIGAFLLCYGFKAFRAALFPLVFLAFTIPIPAAVLAAATSFLKSGSTEAVAVLFTLTGMPYHREGFVFALPHFVIEVADECSGIRSSLALLLTALLAGYMLLRTWWATALLLAAILPFAILKNGIRIVALSLLAERVDPGYLTGQLHHEGGIVFFLLTLAILAPLFALLQKFDAKPTSRVSPA